MGVGGIVLLTHPEADLSLWHSVLCFHLWYGRFNNPSLNGMLAWLFWLGI